MHSHALITSAELWVILATFVACVACFAHIMHNDLKGTNNV